MAYQKNISKKKYNKGKYNNKDTSTTSKLYLLPIIFVISILPLITRAYEYKTPLSKYPWFSASDDYIDIFLYYKQVFFISVSILMIAIIVVRSLYHKKSFMFSPVFIPLAVYALLALLSTIFSKYISYGLTGNFEHFESIFVILGYCLVTYYVFLFVQTEKDVKFIISCMLAGILVLSLLGLTQILKHDFFATETGLKLLLPRKYWSGLEGTTFNFPPGRIYLTLFNPNYVGVYVSLLLPLVTILTLFLKNLRLLPLYILTIAGLVVCLIGSQSKAGIIAVIVSGLLALIILWRYLIKFYYISIPIVIGMIAIVILAVKYSDTVDTLIKQFTNIQKVEYNLTDIETKNDELSIKYRNNTMRIIFIANETQNVSFIFVDDKDQPIAADYSPNDGGIYTITDSRFTGIYVSPCIYNDLLAFCVTIDGQQWFFTNQTGDNTYYYINNFGKLDKINKAPSALSTDYDSFASGRGYIWSRTIPLLSKNILLGSGADTYVLEFPQQDYVNLFNYNHLSGIITKPHSLYLQIGVQSGVVSLLAFLIFYLVYFVSSIRLYIKGHLKSYYAQVGAGVFIGTFGYMISSISNDSSITVAPIFWALIGLGLAVNRLAKPYIKAEIDSIKSPVNYTTQDKQSK